MADELKTETKLAETIKHCTARIVSNKNGVLNFVDSTYAVPAVYETGYADELVKTLREKIERIFLKQLALPPRKKREWYGCQWCGSFALYTLKGSVGDPEGIRNDDKCLVCGGVTGNTKSRSYKLSRSDWDDSGEYDTPYPEADLFKVAIMQGLAKWEESVGADIRPFERDMVEAIYDKVNAQNVKLRKEVEDINERLNRVRGYLEGLK